MPRPFSLLIKPAGPDCNLNCDYCFYRCKKSLFGDSPCRMSPAVLEKLVADYLQLDLPQYLFAFQGGEPTLMGLDFYRRLVELQKKYAKPNAHISNSIQTNGILLNDEWCRFFTEKGFLVGLSLDGPQEIHDTYRKDFAGKGTFERVIAALECCRRNRTEFNILVLLTDRNVTEAARLYSFFDSLEITYLQFIPCVEPLAEDPTKLAPYSITAAQYGKFLCQYFDLWVAQMAAGLASVRIFDTIIQNLLQQPASECTFAQECADYIVIEHTGDAYCCDFYVQPDCWLGNILTTPLEQMLTSPVKRAFAQRKRQLAAKCLICRHLDFCRGGCPKDRAVFTGRWNAPNYLCDAYKMFFEHSVPKMKQILPWLLNQRFHKPPA